MRKNIKSKWIQMKINVKEYKLKKYISKLT